MATSPGPSSVGVGVEYCWRKFPMDWTELQNSSVAHRCGKQEMCTISLEEFWVSSTPNNKTRRRKTMRPQIEEQSGKRACALNHQSHERARGRRRGRHC